jgi:preprotein translocase subunit SecE
MNREQKRSLQRQGQLGPDGEPATRKREQTRPTVAATQRRIRPREFLHEVNVELRKVAWPTRTETINYSTVVLITLAVVMALIFALDYVFSVGSTFLFK